MLHGRPFTCQRLWLPTRATPRLPQTPPGREWSRSDVSSAADHVDIQQPSDQATPFPRAHDIVHSHQFQQPRPYNSHLSIKPLDPTHFHTPSTRTQTSTTMSSTGGSGDSWQDRRGMFQKGKEVHAPSDPNARRFSETGSISAAVRRASASSGSGSPGSPDKSAFPTSGGQRRRVCRPCPSPSLTLFPQFLC